MLDNNPEIMEKLQQIADAADVDLGINVVMDTGHQDPRHNGGFAVDIGSINGKDIGYRGTTNPGMRQLATRVQSAAAGLAAQVDLQVNLGPAGQYSGMDGPFRMNQATTAQHANHIHFGFGLECGLSNRSLRGFQCSR
jgi:hypothetical protein